MGVAPGLPAVFRGWWGGKGVRARGLGFPLLPRWVVVVEGHRRGLRGWVCYVCLCCVVLVEGGKVS